MIYIITGTVNSGKSSYLLTLYNILQTGDGFYNRKIVHDGQYIGQEIVRLETGAACLFTSRISNIPEHWDETFRFKDYSFSLAGLNYANSIIDQSLDNPEPFCIDELGPLELQKNGLYQGFLKLKQTKKDIYAVVREECLSDILTLFQISDHRVIYNSCNYQVNNSCINQVT